MDDVLSQAQAVLLTTAARWLSLADKTPVGLLTRPAAPGEWSALDCLRHLLDTESSIFPQRLQAFLAGQDFPGFNPNSEGRDHGDRTPGELAAEFARQRSQNLAALEQVSPLDLARTVQHGELGAVTLGQMLHQWAAHDLMHTVQAERALMQPFLAGAGPWRRFFADHDLGDHP
ncbi:MAG TPA: DinB family protein [Chloroflexia bacterium]|nr:DinB family protein [Chloroflexia bacterium]